MDHALKRRLIIALVIVSFVSSGGMLARYYFAPAKAKPMTAEERANMAAMRIENYDPANLPPQGDLSDSEYALMLMKLREEANQSDAEPGSALLPVGP